MTVRNPSRALTIALIVVLATSAVAAPFAAAQAGESAGNTSVEKNASDTTYGLNDLRENGVRVPEIHDSWRPIEGETAAAWVKYYPTGATINDDEGSDQWKYLSPSTTVKRNYVVLTVMRLGDVEDEEATLHVVYWNEATREIKEGNTTRTEEYAANQTHEKVSLTLSGRGTQLRVPLKPHYEAPTDVTMWLESSSGTTRWRFTHHSLKSAQSSGLDTAADAALAIGKAILYGAILVLVFGAIGRGLNRLGLVGPMKGMTWWTIVLGLLQLFIVLGAWDTIANTLAVHPEYIALELGLIGFIQGIESKGRESVERAIALRPDLRPVETTLASGQKGLSANGLGHGEFYVTEDGSGRDVVISPGIVSWLFRIMGGREYLDGTDVTKCRTEVTEGKPSRCYFVDPTSERVINRKPPNIEFRLPSPSLSQVGVAAVGLYVLGVTGEAVGVGWTTAVAVAGFLAIPVFVRVEVPNASIVPAPRDFGEAFANSLVLAAEYDAAKTVEEANDAILKKTAEQNVKQAKADEHRSKTLVEETIDGDDPEDVRDVLDVSEVDDVLTALEERKAEKDAEREVAFGDD